MDKEPAVIIPNLAKGLDPNGSGSESPTLLMETQGPGLWIRSQIEATKKQGEKGDSKVATRCKNDFKLKCLSSRCSCHRSGTRTIHHLTIESLGCHFGMLRN
jgi:hypothetical protein